MTHENVTVERTKPDSHKVVFVVVQVSNFKRFDTSSFSKDLVNLPLNIISQIDEDPNSIWLR